MINGSKLFLTTVFHPLKTTMPLPQSFNNPFHYKPHPLSLMAIREVQTYIKQQKRWCEEIEKGKMFGVLIVEDKQHRVGYLAAYSGQIVGQSNWGGFVPAVFDYLQPNGYFKQHEKIITKINKSIAELECNSEYIGLKEQLKKQEILTTNQLNNFQSKIKIAKQKRDDRRRTERLNEDEKAELIKESQFMKAEFRRLKQRSTKQLNLIKQQLQPHQQQIQVYKEKRKQLSDELQCWLFSHFVMRNAKGEEKNLLDIFAPTSQQIPPAGAGECCAPKLLQYAYVHQLRPICMAEFWWGASPKTSIRHHGCCYPACRGKCLPILSFMLQGIQVDKEWLSETDTYQLDIVFEDEALIVVNKPAGLLSVPGASSIPSVYSILRKKYPQNIDLYPVHRLDMATSGLLIIAKSKTVYQHLQKQFALRTVQKEYMAVLDGELKTKEGKIVLPLRPDFLDRPRQVVDFINGKKAVTLYRILAVKDGKTHIALYPKTGRTHQLRIHCAHVEGLNCAIIGDELYGHSAHRLLLHACAISFIHPISGKLLTLRSEAHFDKK